MNVSASEQASENPEDKPAEGEEGAPAEKTEQQEVGLFFNILDFSAVDVLFFNCQKSYCSLPK